MFITLVEHTTRIAGTTVEAFLDSRKAVAWAREQLKEYDRFSDATIREGAELSNDARRCGVLWKGTYGESDSITVSVVKARDVE